VVILDNDTSYNVLDFENLKKFYGDFQTLLPKKKEIKEIDPGNYSFQIAHYSGLDEIQKLELLGIESEEERQGYLIEHFEAVFSSAAAIEDTKKRIAANGHFKNLKSFNFDDPKK
ncbi:hypothetical protein N9R54_06190, partial [Pelobium sp.]